MSSTSTSVSSPGPQILPWDDHTLPELQQQTREIESAAIRLRGYDPDLIPGQLQTLEYATAVLRVCREASSRPTETEAEVEEAVAARMARQADWRAQSGRAHMLIGEQALYTTVGDPQVMQAQLQALREIMDAPGPFTMGIVPRTAAFVAPTTNFLFYDDTMVTTETATCKLIITDPHGLASYEAAFRLLAAQSITGEAGVDMIDAALGHH